MAKSLSAKDICNSIFSNSNTVSNKKSTGTFGIVFSDPA